MRTVPAAVAILVLLSSSYRAQGTSVHAGFSVGLRSFLSSFLGLSARPCPLSEHKKCSEELDELRKWKTGLASTKTLEETRSNPALSQPEGTSPSRRRVLQESEPKTNTKETSIEAEWMGNEKRERDFNSMTFASMKDAVREQEDELNQVNAAIDEMKSELSKLTALKARLDGNFSLSPRDFTENLLSPELMDGARALLKKCDGGGFVLSRPAKTWKGYACSADDESFAQYLKYTDRGVCPDDWPETQNLIFVENCFSLPKRRCFNPTSPTTKPPKPFPQSLFDQEALQDTSVRWTRHGCKSYECLNTRMVGDCRNCFNMGLEKRRWRKGYRGSLSMKDVVALKNGSLRIGLDAGGGSGSFAAHMALYGVTVMTSAMNIETVLGRTYGLPYMETIAQRGLIPLHLPHKARLPFFDNTLDIIHCVNSVKYLPILELEELLFEWDRVLRVGGVMWFEMFYAPMDEIPVYVALIEQLGYNKLHWNMMPKPDYGEKKGLHVYLNCVIEKPARVETKGWFGLG